MTNRRTTIYLNEGAYIAVKKAQINLSEFVNEEIFNHFGFMQSRAELEMEIEHMEEKLESLQTQLGDYENQKGSLDNYCKVVSDCMDRMGVSVETAMTIMIMHKKTVPMCTMTKGALIKSIDEYRRLKND